MDAVIKEVAEEGKRLIDRAWLGELSRAQAVHMFVQVGDGLIPYDTALDIIDEGVQRLTADARRLRMLRWCALLEIPLFGGLAVIAFLLGADATAVLSLVFLTILQFMHYKFLLQPASIDSES